jgi:hypothetical protein
VRLDDADFAIEAPMRADRAFPRSGSAGRGSLLALIFKKKDRDPPPA